MTAYRGVKKPISYRIPGLTLTFGISFLGIGLLILLPVITLFLQLRGLSGSQFLAAAFSPRALAAYKITLKAGLVSALITSLVGFLLAWVLIRYRFPGRNLLDACIDLPFALPTSVAGFALVMLYDYNSGLGAWLDEHSLSPLFNWVGICLAMSFTSLPFGVRLVQLRLAELEQFYLDAASNLGSPPWYTFFTQVFLPLRSAVLSGFLLSLVRSLGEFGSLQFISGNIPFQSETISLLLLIRLDENDYAGAVSIVILVFSLSLLLLFWALHTTGKQQKRCFFAQHMQKNHSHWAATRKKVKVS